jgi:hypothetical protein
MGKWYKSKWWTGITIALSVILVVALVVATAGTILAASAPLCAAMATSSAFVYGVAAVSAASAVCSIAQGAAQLKENPKSKVGWADLCIGLFGAFGAAASFAKAGQTIQASVKAAQLARTQNLTACVVIRSQAASLSTTVTSNFRAAYTSANSAKAYLAKCFEQKIWSRIVSKTKFSKSGNTVLKAEEFGEEALAFEMLNPISQQRPAFFNPTLTADADDVINLMKTCSEYGVAVECTSKICSPALKTILNVVPIACSVGSSSIFGSIKLPLIVQDALVSYWGTCGENLAYTESLGKVNNLYFQPNAYTPQGPQPSYCMVRSTFWGDVQSQDNNAQPKLYDSDNQTVFSRTNVFIHSNQGYADYDLSNVAIGEKFIPGSAPFFMGYANPWVSVRATLYKKKSIQSMNTNKTLDTAEKIINGQKLHHFNGNYDYNMPLYIKNQKFGLITNHISPKYGPSPSIPTR